MFQRRPYENMLIAATLGIFAIYVIGYSMNGQAIFYSLTSHCLFALVGTAAIVLGCAGLYSTWKSRY